MDEILKKLLEDQERSMSVNLDDELVAHVNALLDEERVHLNALLDEERNAGVLSDPELVATMEQFMLEEDQAFMDQAFMAIDQDRFTNVQPDLFNVGYTGITTMALPLIDVKMLSQTLRDLIDTMTVWNYPVNEPAGPKILSSRTPSHEHILEKRAENDLRRRNEGKRILSSRD